MQRGNGMTFEQVAFFFRTVEWWADNPRIGGHNNRGFGLVKGEWSMRARVNHRADIGDWQDIGKITIEPTKFTWPVENPLIQELIVAYNKLIGDPTMDFGFSGDKARSTLMDDVVDDSAPASEAAE
jgi:hypothetical protein